MNWNIILLLLGLFVIVIYLKSVEGFESIYSDPTVNYYDNYFTSYYKNENDEQPNDCMRYGDDYNSCYSDPRCTIWFKPNGSTYCTKKFLQENI